MFVLLLKEAGGTVTTMDGEPYSVFSRSTLASNGALHDELVEVTGARTDALKKKGCDLSPWFIPPGYDFKEV
jgi:myo-inositol-1(or 4)-monophosphatase